MAEWTIEDKAHLLDALKKHGSTHIDAILQELPLKSIYDINTMISRYERLANYSPDEKYDSDSCIERWTEIMRKYTDYSELVPVVRALKYIALFEDRKENNVNLSDCYMMLSDLSQGTPSKQLSAATTRFLFDTFVKVAKEVKKDDNQERTEFLQNINFQNNNISKTYTSYSKKREREDGSVNPLKVPKEMYTKKKKV